MMKMPDPMTAPTPNAVKLHGPRVRSRRFLPVSDPSTKTSMFFVRKIEFTSKDLVSVFAIPCESAECFAGRWPCGERNWLPHAYRAGKTTTPKVFLILGGTSHGDD